MDGAGLANGRGSGWGLYPEIYGFGYTEGVYCEFTGRMLLLFLLNLLGKLSGVNSAKLLMAYS